MVVEFRNIPNLPQNAQNKFKHSAKKKSLLQNFKESLLTAKSHYC